MNNFDLSNYPLLSAKTKHVFISILIHFNAISRFNVLMYMYCHLRDLWDPSLNRYLQK